MPFGIDLNFSRPALGPRETRKGEGWTESWCAFLLSTAFVCLRVSAREFYGYGRLHHSPEPHLNQTQRQACFAGSCITITHFQATKWPTCEPAHATSINSRLENAPNVVSQRPSRPKPCKCRSKPAIPPMNPVPPPQTTKQGLAHTTQPAATEETHPR